MSVTDWSVLEVGACTHPEFMTRKGKGHHCARFPALVGLIEHARMGPILFDTGYDARFFAATDPFPERLYRIITPVTLAPERALELQLAARGYTPADIGHVFLSHFHADHISAIKAFPNAQFHCARLGLMAIRAKGRFNRLRQGLLADLLPDDFEARATFFEDAPLCALPDTLAPMTHGIDLFGDQSLMAIELKGHCPGHWGLLVRAKNQDVFFIGDAAWTLSAIIDQAPPPRLTTALLGQTEPYRATLKALSTVQQTGKVTLIASHCEATARRFVDVAR